MRATLAVVAVAAGLLPVQLMVKQHTAVAWLLIVNACVWTRIIVDVSCGMWLSAC